MASKEWLAFFQDAKIPQPAAKQYAKSFTENRITMEMLMDLNKEYLRDMGIIILGDIIAILKHAKQVQSELTNTDKLASQSAPSKPETNRKVSMLISPKPQDNPPAEPGLPSPAVTQRLGPPKTIHFDNSNVFNRLGDQPPPQASPVKPALERIGPKVEPGKRIVISRQAAPPSTPPKPQPTDTKKKYVLITKKGDGTEVREMLSPSDPRIKQIGVSRKMIVNSKDLKRSVSSSEVVGRKRTRITGPDDGEREPISARLGPKLG